tara:strand:+ start:1130 stop:1888 length:759 start_codon:yes stop_codon:yes gene_type:complete
MNATPAFYLGTDRAHWLAELDVPLFVSRRTLAGRKTFPRATTGWALDSGGFTEIHKTGCWALPAAAYAAEAQRFADEIGNLDWAAPQDWMCEETALEATGLSISDHQRRTTDNFLELRELMGPLVIPVVQGWERDDYLRHVDQYQAAGVTLADEERVGVGSICRRHADQQIGAILHALQPLRLHAFGVKGSAFAHYRDWITSADSMAWSATARRGNIRLPGCQHRGRCSHCSRWALRWRANLLRRLDQHRLF